VTEKTNNVEFGSVVRVDPYRMRQADSIEIVSQTKSDPRIHMRNPELLSMVALYSMKRF
jgi:hypothetical protein